MSYVIYVVSIAFDTAAANVGVLVAGIVVVVTTVLLVQLFSCGIGMHYLLVRNRYFSFLTI